MAQAFALSALVDGLRRLARDPCAATSAMAHVVHAIAALHEAGIAHHDVHPGNVLFRRREGQEDEVVLSDLGRACIGEVRTDAALATRLHVWW